MTWEQDVISKMEYCYAELTGHFKANEWLKPYSQTAGQDHLRCKKCIWASTCKVCTTVVTELQNF